MSSASELFCNGSALSYLWRVVVIARKYCFLWYMRFLNGWQVSICTVSYCECFSNSPFDVLLFCSARKHVPHAVMLGRSFVCMPNHCSDVINVMAFSWTCAMHLYKRWWGSVSFCLLLYVFPCLSNARVLFSTFTFALFYLRTLTGSQYRFSLESYGSKPKYWLTSFLW